MASRIDPVDPTAATGRAQELFGAIQQRFGAVPKVFRTAGNSPAALAVYVGISNGLDASALDVPLRERIALTVAEANGCGYCLSVHSALGRSVGLDADAIAAARAADSSDPRIKAALAFARRLVDARGHISDADLRAVRAAGYSEAEIVDIIAQVIHDTFTNYVAIVAQIESEFPQVAPPTRRAA